MTKQFLSRWAEIPNVRYATSMTFGALLLLLATIPRLTSPTFYAQLSNWRGFFSVVVKPGQDTTSIDIRGAITQHTSWVNVSVIDDVERVAVADIPDRLIEEDPRYDPYVSLVSDYFTDGTNELVYIPDRIPAWAIPLVLAGDGLRLGSVRVTEWQSVTKLLLMLSVGIPGLILFFRMRTAALLIALVPLSLLGQAGTWGLVAGAALTILYCSYLRGIIGFFDGLVRGNKPRMARNNRAFLIAFSTILATFALLPLHPRPGIALLSYAYSVAGLLGANLLWSGIDARVSIRRGHAVFTPIRLVRRSRRSLGLPVALLVVAVAVLGASSYVYEHRSQGAIPVPNRSKISDNYNWMTLSELYLSSNSNHLPGIADFFTHVSYQSYLPYGREYRFPEYGETVSVSSFRREGNRIVRIDRQVAILDSIWYASVFSDAREEPLASMLLSQTHPVVVKRIDAITLRGAVRAISFALLGAAIIALGVVVKPNLTPDSIYGMKNLQHRRKQLIA